MDEFQFARKTVPVPEISRRRVRRRCSLVFLDLIKKTSASDIVLVPGGVSSYVGKLTAISTAFDSGVLSRSSSLKERSRINLAFFSPVISSASANFSPISGPKAQPFNSPAASISLLHHSIR